VEVARVVVASDAAGGGVLVVVEEEVEVEKWKLLALGYLRGPLR
jgi:hypothetical protein